MKKPTLILLVITTVVALILVIVIPVKVVKSKNKNKESVDQNGGEVTTTSSPPSPPSVRYQALLDFLLDTLPEDLQEGLVQLDDELATPQMQAAQWLADQDTYTEETAQESSSLSNSDNQKILQRYAAATFYFSMGGDRWKDCSERSREYCKWTVPGTDPWLSPVDECQWAFLTCNATDGILEEIIVEQRGSQYHGNLLEGTLPKELSLFTNLHTFEVPNNVIKGDIDTAFAGLTSLIRFHVPDNQLSGTFPKYMLQSNTNLKRLDVSANENIQGAIDQDTVLNHPTLTVLKVDGTGLTGFESTSSEDTTTATANKEVAEGVDTTTTTTAVSRTNSFTATTTYNAVLEQLHLQKTQISGTIPSIVTQFPNLQVLKLGDNPALSGTIPSWISSLSKLRVLSLASNSNMRGSLPEQLFAMTQLEKLDVPSMGLTGTMAGVSSLTNLRVFNAAHNKLTGTIPESIRALGGTLMELVLNDNALSGNIPTAIDFLTHLQRLLLEDNDLTGQISNFAACSRRGKAASQLNELTADCHIRCSCCDGDNCDWVVPLP